jgi:glycerate kinase
MKILISPTALKGTLTAFEAAEIIASALPNRVEAIRCPVADGGDDTLECLIRGTGGRFVQATVSGPLEGRSVNARWGVAGDGSTAVVEMAEASGLRLLRPQAYDVLHATTYGTGQLLRFALDAGFRRILVGLGGSATTDGGMGCLRALGVRFFDIHGIELPDGGIHLSRLRRIDLSGLHPAVAQSTIIGLVDVDNPLCGANGAARTFAPQKGATPVQVDLLESALKQFEHVLLEYSAAEIGSLPGAGAAGGMGAGLAALCGARLTAGIDHVLDTLGFDGLLDRCDLVLTSEGRLDVQTLRGKAIAGIARRAQRAGKPVHAFVGQVQGDNELLCRLLGLSSITPITPPGVPVPNGIAQARHFLSSAVTVFLRSAGPTEMLS